MDNSTALIIVAVISLIGNFAASFFSNNKSTAVMQEQIKDVKGDINTLSERVDKHNNLVERMAVVEQSTKSAHKRLDELQKEMYAHEKKE